jgi:hypothetical protein
MVRGYHHDVGSATPLVLVVASDEGTRAAHVAALREAAFRIMTAASGAGAVRTLRRSHDVALVVVDDDVTYTGWLPIARFVGGLGEVARIPVAIVTRRPEARAIARRLGMQPVSPPLPVASLQRLTAGESVLRSPGRPPVPRLLIH